MQNILAHQFFPGWADADWRHFLGWVQLGFKTLSRACRLGKIGAQWKKSCWSSTTKRFYLKEESHPSDHPISWIKHSANVFFSKWGEGTHGAAAKVRDCSDKGPWKLLQKKYLRTICKKIGKKRRQIYADFKSEGISSKGSSLTTRTDNNFRIKPKNN